MKKFNRSEIAMVLVRSLTLEECESRLQRIDKDIYFLTDQANNLHYDREATLRRICQIREAEDDNQPSEGAIG